MVNRKRLSAQTKLVESNGDVRSRKGRSRLLPALLAFVMIAGVFLAAAPTAKAVHNNGAFELGPGANTAEPRRSSGHDSFRDSIPHPRHGGRDT